MGKTIRFSIYVFTILLIGLLSIHWLISKRQASAVPMDVKKQAGFSILYPKNYTIDLNSWHYSKKENALTFAVNKDKSKLLFTEQKTPLAFQDDQAAYERFVGSLKPFANFKTNIGTVSLTRFISAGDFQQQGQTALLNSKGTFVLVHPSGDLDDQAWRDLFSSIAVEK
ncbi:MAG: hypothetical protein NVS1B10_06860 [Candidatus Saccharimonadales bacterium]